MFLMNYDFDPHLLLISIHFLSYSSFFHVSFHCVFPQREWHYSYDFNLILHYAFFSPACIHLFFSLTFPPRAAIFFFLFYFPVFNSLLHSLTSGFYAQLHLLVLLVLVLLSSIYFCIYFYCFQFFLLYWFPCKPQIHVPVIQVFFFFLFCTYIQAICTHPLYSLSALYFWSFHFLFFHRSFFWSFLTQTLTHSFQGSLCALRHSLVFGLNGSFNEFLLCVFIFFLLFAVFLFH